MRDKDDRGYLASGCPGYSGNSRRRSQMTMEPFLTLVDRLGPRLRERGRAIEKIKAMNKRRLELIKANRLLKRKISEFKA
jgi:hypothetical protein